MTAIATKQNVGHIVQVIGAVIDVEFPPEQLPEINNAVLVRNKTGTVPIDLTLEVQQHIGQNQVRCVAMSSTDGLVRGMEAVDLGGPITVPVGNAALGRILNVLGEPVDGGAAIPASTERWPIHRHVPAVRRPRAQDDGLRDRHQGHRPRCPVREGRQGRPLRRRRRRQDRHHPGTHQQRAEGPRRQVGLLRRR